MPPHKDTSREGYGDMEPNPDFRPEANIRQAYMVKLSFGFSGFVVTDEPYTLLTAEAVTNLPP